MKKTERQQKESVVLTGNIWSRLRFHRIEKGSFILTDQSDPHTADAVRYQEGIDFEVDYENGKIRRLPGSALPDFEKNPSCHAGFRSVNLQEIADFGLWHCRQYTAYASYRYEADGNESYGQVVARINQKNQTALPLKLARAVLEKKNLVYGVMGDSISTGCEALEGNSYFSLFADYMKSLGAFVEIHNVAVGGTTSSEAPGAACRLFEEGARPDLVTIGYGMNDMCSLGNESGTAPADYIANTRAAVEQIRARSDREPEIMLISSMPANPIWNYASGGSSALAEALRDYAKEAALPIADANALCHSELDHGKRYPELIVSLINHPGDYGHYLYFLTLKSLLDGALREIHGCG